MWICPLPSFVKRVAPDRATGVFRRGRRPRRPRTQSARAHNFPLPSLVKRVAPDRATGVLFSVGAAICHPWFCGMRGAHPLRAIPPMISCRTMWTLSPTGGCMHLITFVRVHPRKFYPRAVMLLRGCLRPLCDIRLQMLHHECRRC